MFQKAYLVGTHRHSYQPGKPFEILGVIFIKPKNILLPRACYVIRIENGKEDYIPIADSRYYKIISENDIKKGIIPKVDRK